MPTFPRLPIPLHVRRPQAVAAIEAVLILLLGMQCARLLWIAFVPSGPVGAIAGDSAMTSAPASALAAFGDLFHRASSASDAASASGYVLHGVRVDGEAGSAILGKDGRQRSHRVGDVVASGLVLAAVEADHVLLRTPGGDARLVLRQATPAKAATLPAGRIATAAQAGTAIANGVEPGKLLSQVGLRPREGGGYTLLGNGHEALLHQAGLQPGDELVAVDGRALDAESLAELKRDAAGRGQATLTVRRDGQLRTLTVGTGR